MRGSVSRNARAFILRKRRAFTLAELVADGIVHGIGLLVALVAGTVLITVGLRETAQDEIFAISVYVVTLIGVLTASLAFNMCPYGPLKAMLARIDQAAIFLFIAGSYTPLLTALGDVAIADKLLIFVWGASLVGVALKLLVPQHFGRMAILVYLAIGWSGVLAFHALAEALPATALWLIVAGGIAYSAGIVFLLWERLQFQNALWHAFVVLGATLHLVAIFDAMVLSRL